MTFLGERQGKSAFNSHYQFRLTCRVYRKVEGEGKDQGHGSDGRKDTGPAVPMRRWEDWERSRLRKLKREERRRRDFERAQDRKSVV